MQYEYLRDVGLQVSKFCLGTINFGGQISEEDSLRVIDCAVDNGVNFIDTANAYTMGESERIVGKSLAGRRDSVILATKVFNRMSDSLNDVGLSRAQIVKQAEESLRRLGTDYVDIYYLHEPDYHTRLEESLEAMDALVRSGKVRYIGLSNYAAWQVADALAICDKRDYVAPVITENLYNLITRGIENEFTSFLDEHPMSMVIYNPIAAGMLTGKHTFGEPTKGTRFEGNSLYINRYWYEENFKAVDALKRIAEANGMSLLEMSMRWAVNQPHVTSVINGVSKVQHIEQNMRAIEGGPLDSDVLKQCDEVWAVVSGHRAKYNR